MATTYTLITSTTLTGSQASVSFNSIPNTYTDLSLVVSARSDNAAVNDQIGFRLGVTSSVYSTTVLSGNGATASSVRTSGNSYGGLASAGSWTDGNTATSNTFNNWELYIPNYNSSTNKPSSLFGVMETNATTAYMSVNAELMNNTSAVTSITLINNLGSNFLSGSTFYLYGIKSS